MMNSLQQINRYFNEGILNRGDRLLAEFSPSFIRRQNAKLIQGFYRSDSNELSDSFSTLQINISPYQGRNSVVLKIIEYIRLHLSDNLCCAILHGSLADDTQIPYSDFDGLIILKDAIFNESEKIINTAYHLNKTYAMMLQNDPLQHHGWMITSESALKEWPVDFFPPEIFPYCKSLTGQEISHSLRFRYDQQWSKQRFHTFSNSLITRVQKSGLPRNGFGLKSLLSEFMLVPSLYLTAKIGHGCYKKESFEKIGNYFSAEELRVMDEVSVIRNQWPELNKRISFVNTNTFCPAVRRKQIRESALPLLPEIQITKGLEKRMTTLLSTMMSSSI